MKNASCTSCVACGVLRTHLHFAARIEAVQLVEQLKHCALNLSLAAGRRVVAAARTGGTQQAAHNRRRANSQRDDARYARRAKGRSEWCKAHSHRRLTVMG
jgi:hypothetical protein